MLISCAKLMVIFQLSRIFVVATWINLIFYIRKRSAYQHINTPLLSFKELYRNKIIMIILRLINGQIGYISICIPHNNRTTFGGKRQNDEKNLVENGKTAKKIWWKTAKSLFLQ